MIKRNRRSVLALLLVFVLTFSALNVNAFAVTQSEIDALEAEKKKITAKVNEKQAVVDELEAQHASALEQKLAMDQRNEYCQQQIDLNNKQIALYDEMIADKELEVEEAKALEAGQLQRYRTRVRAMEESGGYNILAVILNSTSFIQMLSAIDDYREIMESDRALEDEFIAAREHTEQVKAEYEEYKAGLEEKKAELELEKKELEAKIAEATEFISKLLLTLDAESEELKELLNAEDHAQAIIDAKIAELEEQKRKEAEAEAERKRQQQQQQQQQGGGTPSGGGTVTGTGNFIWPVSCTYITSCVGNRLHPVSGVWKYHSGMDIGCAYGDTVWASDGGTVVIAGENGGYGNCVMIDHGNGYYTLYGHLSSIACSVNQTVSQGQTVGYVGSSGVSTGPHLHFEIRQGTTCLDFSGWFSGLTYAPDSGG